MISSIGVTLAFPYLLLWTAILFIIFLRFNIAAFATLLSILFALFVELIEPQALIPLTLVAATTVCAIIFRRRNKYLYSIFLLLTAMVCFGLGTHTFAGFNNPIIVDHAIVSNDAKPFTLYWNYDKACVAVFLIFLYQSIIEHNSVSSTNIKKSVFVLLSALIVTFTLAYLLGLIRWEPKTPEFLLFWALSNLFITAAAEEGFFRGLIQHHIHQALSPVTNYSGILSISIAGTLFGVAHYAMGPSYVLAAIVAGFGYGLVFHLTKRLETSIITHYLLNSIHILFFTYPMLESGG